jgi:hypothetical protein
MRALPVCRSSGSGIGFTPTQAELGWGTRLAGDPDTRDLSDSGLSGQRGRGKGLKPHLKGECGRVVSINYLNRLLGYLSEIRWSMRRWEI